MTMLRRILTYFVPIFLICFTVATLYKWNYIQHGEHEPSELGIPVLGTGYDTDNDGIEDGADIVVSAKNYVSRKPSYSEDLDSNGWAEGNRGMAADVVAWGFKGAGFDLQALIWQDITRNPEAYGDNPGNENTAFRKSENQRIFMSRYFDSYTTDYEDFKEWQSGDVIFFESGHVALVSDKVNDKGIRFIIHHFWQYQAGYVQDVLTTNAWGKIVGHYRVNQRALTPVSNGTKTKKTKTTK